MSRVFVSLTTVATLIVAGCASHPDIQRQSAETRFVYQAPEPQSPTDVTVAMLEPHLRSASEHEALEREATTPYMDVALTFQQQARSQVEDYDPEKNPFQRAYIETYQQQIEAALQRDMRKMLEIKGFRAASTFREYDDIGEKERREALLLAVPTATIALSRDIVSTHCGSSHCTETGRLRLDGQFLFLLVEPESAGIFGVRRVNLSLERVSAPYVRQTLRDDAGEDAAPESPPVLVDTSDKALVEVLNGFYASMLDKMDGLLYRRQILAFNSHMRALGHEYEDAAADNASSQ